MTVASLKPARARPTAPPVAALEPRLADLYHRGHESTVGGPQRGPGDVPAARRAPPGDRLRHRPRGAPPRRPRGPAPRRWVPPGPARGSGRRVAAPGTSGL